MKRCCTLISALALMLSLCACGKTEEAIEPTAAPGSATTAVETVAPISSQMGSGVFDSFAAKFVGAELFTTADGTQALRVYFDFTNLSDSAAAPMDWLLISAVQDGQTLNWAQDINEDAQTGQSSLSLRLQPNHSARCILQYALVSESTVAVLLDDSNGHTVSALFAIGYLPGAPEEALIQSGTATDEPIATDLPSECTILDLYTAAITGSQVNGEVLTVSVDLTNNSNPTPVEVSGLFTLSAYQDGLELTMVETETLSLSTAAAGETVHCELSFFLRSDSAILVELYGFREQTPGAALVVPMQ